MITTRNHFTVSPNHRAPERVPHFHAGPDSVDWLGDRVSRPLGRFTAGFQRRCAQEQSAKTATPLPIDWRQIAEDATDVPLSRPVVQGPAGARCPHCKALIYSRRHALCGVCGLELPKALLFSEAEAWRVSELVRIERAQHRIWMKARA